MSVSNRSQNLLAQALCDQAAAAEICGGEDPVSNFTTLATTGDATIGGNVLIASGKVLKINSIQVVGAQQAAPTNVAVTFTTNARSTYASPTGALTIGNGTSPTVAELGDYCDELHGVISAILAVLHTHGLTT
jgi:hypothetical protein